MQFARPSSKASRSAPIYSGGRSSRSPWLRRVRLRPLILSLLVGIPLTIYLLSLFTGRSSVRAKRRQPPKEIIPPGTPEVVLVTSFDKQIRSKYESVVVANRNEYAEKHGYAVFFANNSDYDLADPPAPSSWAKVPAMRHAMTAFPHSTWFFYLDQLALIMEPDVALEEHVLSPSKIEELMLVDKPVVPPDSVIRTYRNTKPDAVDAIFTQDAHGLGATSFFVRRGEWAKYFLDAWFDPLYRSYNFQKAEAHALEHLVQWHGTVLLKLVLVPQRTFNSYTTGSQGEQYRDGDFVANLQGCNAADSGRSCENEMRPLSESLKKRGFLSSGA